MNKEPNLTLQEAKDCVGPGWHFLLDLLDNFVKMKQSWYLMNKEGKYQKPEKELFTFQILQNKEKWGKIRIHAECRPVEHDWEIFDHESYLEKLGMIQDDVYTYIAALEDFSGYICEESGDRGTMRNIGGWMKTLSDQQNEIFMGKRNLQMPKKTNLPEILEKVEKMTHEEKVAAADNFFGKLEDLDKENAKK